MGGGVESGFAAGCGLTAEGPFEVTKLNLFQYIFNLCIHLIIVDADSTVGIAIKMLKGENSVAGTGQNQRGRLGGAFSDGSPKPE